MTLVVSCTTDQQYVTSASDSFLSVSVFADPALSVSDLALFVFVLFDFTFSVSVLSDSALPYSAFP